MSNKLTLQELLESGAHFGHHTEKWNPKMRPYVYGERNGIYIIDLAKTVPMAAKAYDYIKNVTASGKSVLFVGTKRQASEIVKNVAEECGAFYVCNRWLGGMLTNFKTISASIDKIRKVEKMKENGDYNLLTKKEQGKIEKEVVKLEKNLGGIKNMRKLPGAIFIVDPGKENIAVKEAKHLNIPIVAITDTNCDPSGIEHVIPANDDALKSIELITSFIGNAVAEGSQKVRRNKGDSATKDKALENEMVKKYEKDLDVKESAEAKA
jgi:small subunit ribosomal protein S2